MSSKHVAIPTDLTQNLKLLKFQKSGYVIPITDLARLLRSHKR